MTKQNFKRGDTRPATEYTPIENNRRVSVPDGVSATFELVDPEDNVALVTDAQATVESTDPLTLSYTFSDGETDVAGDYEAEFEVEYSDGGTRTFPDRETIGVSIHPDLDADGTISVDDTRHDVTVGTIDAEVGDFRELSVSDNGPLTNLPYTDGDRVILDQAQSDFGNTTIQSTSYTNIQNSVNSSGVLTTDKLSTWNFSDYYIRFQTTARTSTSSNTVTIRCIELPDTTVQTSSTGINILLSDEIQIPDSQELDNYRLEAKVDSGEATVFPTKFQLLGEI